MINALQAELTKALTLRSIQLTLLAALLVSPALALASGLSFTPAAPGVASFPIESHGFETAGFTQPVVILFTALITGTEYFDGQLHRTLLSTPKRGKVFMAKLLIVATIAGLIGVIATSAAVVLKHAALGDQGLPLNKFTTGMGWNLVGVSLNYALIAVIAAAITMLARTYIVTLVVLVPLVLGLTISLLGLFPLVKYLPDLAGIQLLTSYPGVGLLDPVPGALVMTGWTITLTGAAFVAFTKRDTAGH